MGTPLLIKLWRPRPHANVRACDSRPGRPSTLRKRGCSVDGGADDLGEDLEHRGDQLIDGRGAHLAAAGLEQHRSAVLPRHGVEVPGADHELAEAVEVRDAIAA